MSSDMPGTEHGSTEPTVDPKDSATQALANGLAASQPDTTDAELTSGTSPDTGYALREPGDLPNGTDGANNPTGDTQTSGDYVPHNCTEYARWRLTRGTDGAANRPGENASDRGHDLNGIEAEVDAEHRRLIRNAGFALAICALPIIRFIYRDVRSRRAQANTPVSTAGKPIAWLSKRLKR